MYLLPLEVSGNAPDISIPILSKGAPTNISPMGALGVFGGFFTIAHLSHLSTHRSAETSQVPGVAVQTHLLPRDSWEYYKLAALANLNILAILSVHGGKREPKQHPIHNLLIKYFTMESVRTVQVNEDGLYCISLKSMFELVLMIVLVFESFFAVIQLFIPVCIRVWLHC